jgi:hypothetical protein
LFLPHEANATPAQKYPEPIIDPPNGVIALPYTDVVPPPDTITEGVIDWSQVVTIEQRLPPLDQAKIEAIARMIAEMEAFLKRFKIGFLPSEIDNWPNLLANSQRILAEGEDAYAPDVKTAASMLKVSPTDYAQMVIQKATKLGELVGASTAIRTIGERKINATQNLSEVEAALREIRQLATMAAAKLGYQL